MLKYLPLPDTERRQRQRQLHAHLADQQQVRSSSTRVKVEHKFTDNVSLSGFYLYNQTDEPDANYFGTADQTEPTRFADPNDYILVRRPQILALNNTWVLSDSSVLALRFGMTRFPDNNTLSIDFDPATLGFSPTYLESDHAARSSRSVRIRGYDQFARPDARRDQPDRRSTGSRPAPTPATRSSSARTPFKVGGDFRKIGVDTYIPGDGAGFFDFDKDMTSSNGGTGSTHRRQRLRLVPARLSVDASTHRARSRSRRRSTSSPTTTAATRRTTGASARS